MEEKINPWMIISIILLIISIILLANIMIDKKSYYDLGSGLKIKKSTLNDFSDAIGGKPFKLCSVSDKCITIGRIG